MRASKAASNPSRPWVAPVEWASCLGALLLGELNSPRVAPVEWASCVELASCQFQYLFARAGCPLYLYSFKD
ncbi:MAG: hypothetical protein F6K44_06245 [Moorea sp. SIO3E2]|nr:hypothetical protein [Moorena sp. SIO3E2]